MEAELISDYKVYEGVGHSKVDDYKVKDLLQLEKEGAQFNVFKPKTQKGLRWTSAMDSFNGQIFKFGDKEGEFNLEVIEDPEGRDDNIVFLVRNGIPIFEFKLSWTNLLEDHKEPWDMPDVVKSYSGNVYLSDAEKVKIGKILKEKSIVVYKPKDIETGPHWIPEMKAQKFNPGELYLDDALDEDGTVELVDEDGIHYSLLWTALYPYLKLETEPEKKETKIEKKNGHLYLNNEVYKLLVDAQNTEFRFRFFEPKDKDAGPGWEEGMRAYCDKSISLKNCEIHRETDGKTFFSYKGYYWSLAWTDMYSSKYREEAAPAKPPVEIRNGSFYTSEEEFKRLSTLLAAGFKFSFHKPKHKGIWVDGMDRFDGELVDGKDCKVMRSSSGYTTISYKGYGFCPSCSNIYDDEFQAERLDQIPLYQIELKEGNIFLGKKQYEKLKEEFDNGIEFTISKPKVNTRPSWSHSMDMFDRVKVNSRDCILYRNKETGRTTLHYKACVFSLAWTDLVGSKYQVEKAEPIKEKLEPKKLDLKLEKVPQEEVEEGNTWSSVFAALAIAGGIAVATNKKQEKKEVHNEVS